MTCLHKKKILNNWWGNQQKNSWLKTCLKHTHHWVYISIYPSFLMIPRIHLFMKQLEMCHPCIQYWLRSLDLPKPVSSLGQLLAHAGSAGARTPPSPFTAAPFLRLLAESRAGFHSQKLKESHPASFPVREWRGATKKMRVRGFGAFSRGKRDTRFNNSLLMHWALCRSVQSQTNSGCYKHSSPGWNQ